MSGGPGELKGRIERIIYELNDGLYEREDVIAVGLLAVLSGQSVFLYGPPGTAKSMAARRISCAFRDAKYFEYLMQRFSTPEDVFGPVSIAELKRDNYVRKTANYLPDADIAFLDEIWKSSPAILNTLLTIINERRFRNGAEMTDVPLKALIAASNEFPPERSGLGALYDRFIVRLKVSPMSDRKDFEAMLEDPDAKDTAFVSYPLSTEEWKVIMSESRKVPLGRTALDVIDRIRRDIDGANRGPESPSIYVSDRRWQKAAALLRTSAYVSGRSEVSLQDMAVLRHVLWSSEADRPIIENIVKQAVAGAGPFSRERYDRWKKRFAKLEGEVESVLRAGERERTEYLALPTAGGRKCVAVTVLGRKYYLPADGMVLGKAVRSLEKDPDGTYVPSEIFFVTNVSGRQFHIVADLGMGNQQYDVSVPRDVAEVPASEADIYRRTAADMLSGIRDLTVAARSALDAFSEGSCPFLAGRDLADFRGTAQKAVKEVEGSAASAEELKRYVDGYGR